MDPLVYSAIYQSATLLNLRSKMFDEIKFFFQLLLFIFFIFSMCMIIYVANDLEENKCLIEEWEIESCNKE